MEETTTQAGKWEAISFAIREAMTFLEVVHPKTG
jgi:hypothetical protein